MYHLMGIQQNALDDREEVRFLISALFVHVILVSAILTISTDERVGAIS